MLRPSYEVMFMKLRPSIMAIPRAAVTSISAVPTRSDHSLQVFGKMQAYGLEFVELDTVIEDCERAKEDGSSPQPLPILC